MNERNEETARVIDLLSESIRNLSSLMDNKREETIELLLDRIDILAKKID